MREERRRESGDGGWQREGRRREEGRRQCRGQKEKGVEGGEKIWTIFIQFFRTLQQFNKPLPNTDCNLKNKIITVFTVLLSFSEKAAYPENSHMVWIVTEIKLAFFLTVYVLDLVLEPQLLSLFQICFNCLVFSRFTFDCGCFHARLQAVSKVTRQDLPEVKCEVLKNKRQMCNQKSASGEKRSCKKKKIE